MIEPTLHNLRLGIDGLIPAVVQDAVTGDVLMLASMNAEAVRLTATTRQAHYWSRSRKKLWRKGETSGHIQYVDEIRVNCEQSSLLLIVRQIGAVCHDGYPTCFYRRVEDNGELTVVRERAFDPSAVYGDTSLPQEPGPAPKHEIDPLAEATRRQFGAYVYLRDHDLTSDSRTSHLLRDVAESVGARIADELRELAGVLAREHRHTDPVHDLRLEASQVMYWVLLHALRERVTWSRLRPDRALARSDDQIPAATVVRLLRADADRWESGQLAATDAGALAHATLHLVGLACQSGGLDPLAVVKSDLEALQTRPYLAPYFEPAA